MDQIPGGATTSRHRRSPPATADRLLLTPHPQTPSPAHPLELSEHDIFDAPSGSSTSSPSPTHSHLKPYPKMYSPNRHDYGILAALNGNLTIRSASLSSSSSSTSPAPSVSSRITIPRPPTDSLRFNIKSAPIDVPVGLRRRGLMEWNEEEEEGSDGVVLPPHELVASRHSPMLACSVLEGAGRTLKGRDLRQVRNAIWRKTGFID